MVPASPLEASLEKALELFGSPRKFRQDRAAIQKRYYELSRELHPDRFLRSPPEERAEAIARMSRLNEAYELLKDADAWRDYLLGGTGEAKGKLPLELASDWFELQDENPGRPALSAFRARVVGALEESATRIAGLEADLDALAQADAVSVLALKESVLLANTLRSLLRDVDRALERSAGQAGA